MYTGIKEVKKHNTDEFIKLFKTLRSFGIMTKYGDFYEVKKSDIWRVAKTTEILYTLSDKIYRVKRTSMVLY